MQRDRWKKIAKEIAIGVLILFVVSNVISYLRKPDLSSDMLPVIEVKLLDGSSFNAPREKPLVIHFWGTWCPVCKVEASNIQALSEKYDVLTIAVNSGSDDVIKAYMRERQLNFRVFNDREGKWAKQFDIEVFPTTFIYDAKGDLRFSEVGYTTTAGLLARMAIVE